MGMALAEAEAEVITGVEEAQEVEVKGMEVEGQTVMTGEAIGTGLFLMIVLEGEAIYHLMIDTEIGCLFNYRNSSFVYTSCSI